MNRRGPLPEPPMIRRTDVWPRHSMVQVFGETSWLIGQGFADGCMGRGHAGRLRGGFAEGPDATLGMMAEPTARSTKTELRTVCLFLHAEGLRLRNGAAHRTAVPRHRLQAQPVAGQAGQDRPAPAGLHRSDPDQVANGDRCACGPFAGRGWTQACTGPMKPSRPGPISSNASPKIRVPKPSWLTGRP